MGKSKGKRRSLPQPLPSTNAVDLFLLAGFPNPLHASLVSFCESLFGIHSKVIASPSPTHDGSLYRRQTIRTLLTAASQFAVRRLKNRSDDQSARPRRIALFYVPAEDDELLLQAFDFFVFPIALRSLSIFDEAGAQGRHKRQRCEEAIQQAVELYKIDFIGSLQRRIESRKSHEPLLLPPVNFHWSDGRLKQIFCELTRGIRTWQGTLPEAVCRDFQ